MSFLARWTPIHTGRQNHLLEEARKFENEIGLKINTYVETLSDEDLAKIINFLLMAKLLVYPIFVGIWSRRNSNTEAN
jgi:hypothetical protein